MDWTALGGAIAGAITALPAAAYIATRKIKQDRREDAAATLADSLRAELVAQVRELTGRADVFAAQRNEAIERAAGLAGQVEGLRNEVARLAAELADTERRMADLQHSNEALTRSNQELTAKIAALIDENIRLKGQHVQA